MAYRKRAHDICTRMQVCVAHAGTQTGCMSSNSTSERGMRGDCAQVQRLRRGGNCKWQLCMDINRGIKYTGSQSTDSANSTGSYMGVTA